MPVQAPEDSRTLTASSKEPRIWRRSLVVNLVVVFAAMLVLPFDHFAQAATAPPHVAFIAMENHGYTTIVGNSAMPFTQSLINNNGIASITDTCHPSLPNYLSITDGSIHGCPQDTAPSDATYPGPTFYDELANAGIGWKAYVDGAAGNCDINSGFGNFDVNHAPQAYYDSIRNSAAQCNRIVPASQLGTDLSAGTAPPFIWITPNLTNDMHDGTDQQGDAYLNSQVTQLRNSSWFTPGSRILIWWDEDEGTSNEQILLISVGSSHSVTISQASHYGVLRGLEEAYGVGLLGNSALSNAPDQGPGVVGDILPLLNGAAPPAPSPSPTPTPTPPPSPSPSPPPSPSPTPSTSPSPPPSPSPVPGPSSGTRGIFRYTSTDFAAMHADGFNASTDGGVQDNGAAQAAAGINGMVWVDAYNNQTCVQTMTNSAIQAMVTANVNAGSPGLRYEIGDEPTAFGCNAAATYSSITQAVHAVDATAKTWVADDQFQVGSPIQSGVPMKGTVDILAFDVYPCETGACDYSAIDSAVQQIHAAGVTNWEFIIQDFSSSPWRWPTPAEIQAQFDHWKNQGAIGYWVYAWDYQGQQVILQTGNVAALQSINSQAINGSPPPSPSPSPSPSPTPSPVVASASANLTTGNAPLAVAFTGSASGGVAPYTFAWSFGDGGSSSAQNPGHTYASAGTFAANFRVTDSVGASALSNTVTVTVNGPLAATARATPTAGDAPLAVAFTGSGAGGTTPYSYGWAFGDGSTSTSQSPSHTYTSPGTFTATLQVTDAVAGAASASVTVVVSPGMIVGATASANRGAAPLAVNFTGTATGGRPPLTYSWLFGDGAGSSSLSPSHTYTIAGNYTALFTVTDANSAHVTATALNIVVTPALSVTGSVLPTAGDAPMLAAFTSAVQGGSAPYTYAWSFGDGGTSTLANPSHSYTGAGTYTASVTVTDSVSATATVSGITVRVNPLPSAGASASASTGDAPATISFTGTVSGGTAPYSYAWTFGDGGTSTAQNPSHTYAGAGTYSANMTVTDADSAGASAATLTIVISPSLSVTSTAGTTSGNVPLSVAFTSTPNGGRAPFTYAWTFGDGVTSTLQNPSHTYSHVGIYSADLTVTDANGISAVASTLLITVNGPLAAAASVSPSAGDAPATVAFTGVGAGGTAPYRFGWTFGDGGTSSSQDPSHTYAGAGTFTATLTVTDAAGTTATTTATVVVSPTLTANASASVSGGAAPLAVNFTGATTGGLGPFTYVWTFGDGTTSTSQNPAHTYAGAGTYSVNLTVTDANHVSASAATVTITVFAPLSAGSTAGPRAGDAPVSVTFTGSATGGISPYTFAWAFGDGANSTSQNPSHTYTGVGTYSAVLTVTDSAGHSAAAAALTITVSPALSVSDNANPSAGNAPLTVSFTSTPSGGLAPYTYRWTFGDGGTSTSQNPAHGYGTAGTYSANLVVTDANGVTANASALSITVNGPLAAMASASPQSGDAPLTVTFTGTGAGGTAPYSYSWVFGDGATSTSQNPSHTYSGVGSYTAVLTVTDASGAHATAGSLSVAVNPLPSVTSAATSSAGDAPVTVGFSGLVTGGTGPFTYAWSFGDGASSTNQNPGHTYSAAGTYSALLAVTDAAGHSATAAALTIAVSPTLTVSDTASPNTGRAPLAVGFTSTPGGGLAPYVYAWTFGDGGTATSQNPSHTYSAAGTYGAGLKVTDANGTTIAASALNITAIGLLSAAASAAPTTGDAPFTATLNASTTGGIAPYTYAWDLGDGTTSTAKSPTHLYSSAGTYTASVTVNDGSTQIASASVQVVVYTAMSVSVSASPPAGVASLQVSFSGSASGGLAPYTFAWTYGDGSSGSGASATHSYGAGTFHPTLTVHDAAGGTWSGSAGTIDVTAPPAAQQPAPVTAPPAASLPNAPALPTSSPTSSPTSGPSVASPAATSPTQNGPSGPGGPSSPSGQGLVLVLIGSLFVTGLGGALFLSWLRRRA